MKKISLIIGFVLSLAASFGQGPPFPPFLRWLHDVGTLGGPPPTDSITGKIPIPYIGTGTPTGTNFLRGDGVWATPAGGSGGSGSGFSARALGIPLNGSTDATSTIQGLYNAGTRLIDFDSSAATLCRIQGKLDVPGLYIHFWPGNSLTTALQTGTGTFATTIYSRTVTGTGTSFTTAIYPGYLIVNGTTVIGQVETIESNTSLTLRVPAAATTSGITLKYYGGVIHGATLLASYDQKICTENITLDCYSGEYGNMLSVKWYGALGQGIYDDRPFMQKSLDDGAFYNRVATVYVPVGDYPIYKGLVLRHSNTNGATYPYTGLGLYGAGSVYDRANAGVSSIQVKAGNTFAVGIQRGKGNIIQNLYIEGPNQLQYSTTELLEDTSTFVLPGMRNNHQSPLAGIVIDPFGQSSLATGNRYPGFEEYYTETNQAGSTFINVNNCAATGFVVNYCVSPTGQQQNGEDVTFYKCKSTTSLVAFGNYNSQTINNFCREVEIWGKTKFGFDAAYIETGNENTLGYGQGGQSFEIDGANLQNVKWLCRLPQSYSNIRITRARCEVVYGIGGCFSLNSTGSTHIFMDNCWMNLSGSKPEDSNYPVPQYIGRAQDFSFTNCTIVNYERPGNRLNFLASTVSWVNCLIQPTGWVKDQINNVMTREFATDGPRLNGAGNFETQTEITSATSNATVSGVSRDNADWRFSVSSTSGISVGDAVYIYSTTLTNEFGVSNNVIIPAGHVKSLPGSNVVVVNYLFYGIVNGLNLNTVYTKKTPSP